MTEDANLRLPLQAVGRERHVIAKQQRGGQPPDRPMRRWRENGCRTRVRYSLVCRRNGALLLLDKYLECIHWPAIQRGHDKGILRCLLLSTEYPQENSCECQG